ncbi:MAG: hypothetical protein D6723_07390 [Acidobacteria bacterium]|nr:MAG: hypothetical protein D6723_07390 [Acidobacteriota bacterium]
MNREQMTPERWHRIETLFEAALERAPQERAAFLDEACGGDEALRQQVMDLLNCHKEAGSFMEAPVGRGAAQMWLQDEAASLVGRRIGPYRLTRRIGQGGMGEVYLAVRADEQYHKQVAVKLIRRGLDNAAIIRRFRQERQILARLDHPHIAKLLDGGTTEEGLPYFVMEYIEGVSITDYCDRHMLSTVERLKLVRQVCAAVGYAHRNLVVHRDLKPSNILVTAEGVPKLVDFGIAKILHPESASQTIETTTEVRPMTPEYASPEQVRGEPITTASDVYSLGVVLYELLTGHRPYRLKTGRPLEMMRAICEEEPERPSTAISREEERSLRREGEDEPGGDQSRVTAGEERSAGGVTVQVISRRRGTTPERLRRRLKGDLDAIVMKALRKESERRYASVEQMSEDIRRHLEGLPVMARRGTFRYRAGKFIRRHWAGVVAAAAIVLTLIGGIVATAWQARVAARERDKARREAQKVERINSFLQQVFGAAHPFRKGRQVTVVEALHDAAQRMEEELADQPEVLAMTHRSIGIIYYSIGLFDAAEPHLRAALKLHRDIYGDEHPETAQSLFALGYFLWLKGAPAEAEGVLKKYLEISRRSAGDQSREVADALLQLGLVMNQKGDLAAAESFYREALTRYRKLLGEEDKHVAYALNNLAVLKSYQGDLDAAEKLYRRVIAIQRKLPADRENQINLATNLQNLGATLKTKGRYAEAEPLLREALDLRRRLLGENHPWIATAQIHWGDLLYRRGRYAEAEREIRAALRLQRETLPEGHIDLARALVVLGQILTSKGEPEAGEPYLREALAIRKKGLARGHVLISLAEGALGQCLMAQGRYAEAEPLLVQSYDEIHTSQGDRDPRTAEALNRLVVLYDAWRKPQRAAQYRALIPR